MTTTVMMVKLLLLLLTVRMMMTTMKSLFLLYYYFFFYSFAFSRNLVPDNVVSACFEKAQTVYTPQTSNNITRLVRSVSTSSGTNILGKRPSYFLLSLSS